MQATFFGARLPLTKTIVLREGEYVITPYPHVSKITSYHATFQSLAELEALLRAHARQGHCLFNGQLTQPLTDESRAGKTLKGAQREWVVFDFDRVPAASAEEAISKFLPSCCQNVSYIVQYSASMFRPGGKSFSGHIFMALASATTEGMLRDWFESINFTQPALEKELTLTDSGLALHWPLDRSAAFDSKLIYIATPRCYGFDSAIDSEAAIRLVKKKLDAVEVPKFDPVPRGTIEGKINALRRQAGLPEKDFRTRTFNVGAEEGEVLVGSDPGMVSDIKPMGEHYIKFNLNGGNSMGYWIDLRNPAVIKNFKGEPWLLTKEIDERLFKSLSVAAPKLVANPPIEDGMEVLAFYATNQNSAIKIGTYSPQREKLELYGSTETASKIWLTEFGVVRPQLQHMFLEFNPKSDIQYVPGSKVVNTFQRTSYMRQEPSSAKPSTASELPPLVGKIIRSILGYPSEDVLVHFLNWLAFIFQRREKTGTAWVLSGRTGTGKSSFIRYILSPLFGSDCVVIKQYGTVGENFNGYLERALFVVFEECDTGSVSNTAELMSKLRHWITDSPVAIRRMNTDSYEAASYANFFFTSNKRTPVEITSDDRRFNIADRQEVEIHFTPNEILALESGSELQVFADVLHRWPVNVALVHKPVMTQAREDMHEATTPINQLIAEAVRSGDLQFFIDRTPTEAEAAADFFGDFNPSGMYRELIDRSIGLAEAGQPAVVKESDLFVLFRTLIPDSRYFQSSKTWRKRHYKSLGLNIEQQHRVGEKRERGLLVTWRKPSDKPPAIEDNGDKVVPIKRKAKERT